MSEERRRFKRLGILADVSYKKKGAFNEEITFTKNIGAGGICIFTNDELNPLDILELRISHPFEVKKPIKLFGFLKLNIKNFVFEKKKEIIVLGKVIWAKNLGVDKNTQKPRYEIGVEFINVSDDDRETINKFIIDSTE